MLSVRNEYHKFKQSPSLAHSTGVTPTTPQMLSSSPMSLPKLSPLTPQRPSPSTMDPKIQTFRHTSKGIRRISGIHIPKTVDRKKHKKQASLSLRITPLSIKSNKHKLLVRDSPTQKTLKSSDMENRRRSGSAIIRPISSPKKLDASLSPCSTRSSYHSQGSCGRKRGKHLSEKGEAEMDAILRLLSTEEVVLTL
jgi:hypothetical protein